MTTLNLGDAALSYEWRPGSGLTLVLLHEMGGSMEGWQEVWDSLPAGQAVLRYDQRGCGGSSAGTAQATVARHVADLRELVDRLGVTLPLIPVGTAVGGAIALAFAATYPEAVHQVLALAPACGIKPERAAPTRQLAARVRAEGMAEAFLPLAQVGWPASCRREDGRYDRFVNTANRTAPAGVAATLEMLAGMDLDPLLPRIQSPALVVGGLHDGLRPREEVLRVASLIPGAQTRFIDSGHFVHVERPDLVADLIRETIGVHA